MFQRKIVSFLLTPSYLFKCSLIKYIFLIDQNPSLKILHKRPYPLTELEATPCPHPCVTTALRLLHVISKYCGQTGSLESSLSPAAPVIQSCTQRHRPSEYYWGMACPAVPTQLEVQRTARGVLHAQKRQQSGRLSMSASAHPA